MPPRTANSPRVSTRSVRWYPAAASASIRASRPMSSPAATTAGPTGEGLTRCIAARTDATTTPGAFNARACRASTRCAMVPTLGDTCSNGSVSQAGIRRADGVNNSRSSARSSASRSPGTIASTQRSRASEASVRARRPAGTMRRPGMVGTRSRSRSTSGASGAGTAARVVSRRGHAAQVPPNQKRSTSSAGLPFANSGQGGIWGRTDRVNASASSGDAPSGTHHGVGSREVEWVARSVEGHEERLQGGVLEEDLRERDAAVTVSRDQAGP